MRVYTKELYLAVKMDEITITMTGKRLEVEVILIGDISQIQKTHHHIFSLIRGP